MTTTELLDEAHDVANAVATELKQWQGRADEDPSLLFTSLGRLSIKAERLCERIERGLPDDLPPRGKAETLVDTETLGGLVEWATPGTGKPPQDTELGAAYFVGYRAAQRHVLQSLSDHRLAKRWCCVSCDGPRPGQEVDEPISEEMLDHIFGKEAE